MAERQGIQLRKSRRRDPRAVDYGRRYIVDAERELAAAEIGGYASVTKAENFAAHKRALEVARLEFVVKECDDLDAVEAFLTDDERGS